MASRKCLSMGLGLAFLANVAIAAPPTVRGSSSRGGSNSAARQQIQSRVQDQAQRRIGGAASQSVQRQADAAQRRIDSTQRRAGGAQRAAEAQTRQSTMQPGGQSSSRSQGNLNRGGRPVAGELPDQAAQQARLHSMISEGLRTGKPLQMDPVQREIITEVFGDASLLDSVPTEESAIDPPFQGNRFARGRSAQNNNQLGSQANPRARLANAVRVRQSQISSLRDRALESDDPKLLERADKMEQTLARFLEIQARFEQSGPPRERVSGVRSDSQPDAFGQPETTQPDARSASKPGFGQPLKQ